MEREQDLFAVRAFYPEAEIAGDVFVVHYGAYGLALRITDHPAHQVFLLFFLKIIGIDRLSCQFVGVFERTDAGEAHQGTVVSPGRKRFKIKGNRQSIEFDEYRFLKVHILRGDVEKA